MLNLKDILNGEASQTKRMEKRKMRIFISKNLDQKQELLFLGLFEEERNHYQAISKELAKELEEIEKGELFKKKFAELYATKISDLPYKRVIVVGMGRKEEFTEEKLRQLLGKVVSFAKGICFDSFTTNLAEKAKTIGKDAHLLGMATAEGLLLANYDFTKYLSKDKQQKKKPVSASSIQWTGHDSFAEGLKKGRVIAESANFVRDLVNEPANVVNSTYLEKVARSIAATSGKIKLKVLNKAELKQEQMGALLGVNYGSHNPPKLLLLEYKGRKGKHTAILGKGITFDSGGYNLKPTRYIEDMKSDMAGGAAVIGIIKAAAELGIKKNILGVVPICENMISSTAQRPGDIIRAHNGKTIEIGNTDAEGRLILADALSYTEKKYSPEIMIDLATLTGSCVVALGYYAAGMIGKDEKLLQELQEAGRKSGDRVWSLPFFEEYHDWMDGSITDLNNSSQKGKGHEGGSITAAVFLSKFVEKAKWAHIDIAGSAYWGVDGYYLQKGATGSGVRVLMYYLLKS